jgi:hypothetical protein
LSNLAPLHAVLISLEAVSSLGKPKAFGDAALTVI